MSYVLSHLHHRIPVMGCKVLLAVGTLSHSLYELHQLCLLHFDFVINLFLYLDPQFDPLGVRLSPDKLGGFQSHFVQSLHFPKEQRQQLLRFPFTIYPGRSFVSQTESAREDLLCS